MVMGQATIILNLPKRNQTQAKELAGVTQLVSNGPSLQSLEFVLRFNVLDWQGLLGFVQKWMKMP